jgi:hypothetical protein
MFKEPPPKYFMFKEFPQKQELLQCLKMLVVVFNEWF